MSLLSLQISKTEVRDRKVYYQISLSTSSRSWSVWRRYSEFEALNSAWLSAFPHAPPPGLLPPKAIISLFVSPTDPQKIAERRQGLEAYLLAAFHARDPRWRTSKQWIEFLGLPETPVVTATPEGGSSSLSSSVVEMDPEEWMETYRGVQAGCREVRSLCAARDRHASTGDAAAAASSALQARKVLNVLTERIGLLSDVVVREETKSSATGMVVSSGGAVAVTKGDVGLSKAELLRRSDLVMNVKDERERLVRLLGGISVGSSAASIRTGALMDGRGTVGSSTTNSNASSGLNTVAAAASSATSALFGSPARSSSPLTALNSSSPVLYQSRPIRRFGAAPPQETEVTRKLDNEGLLQLQKDTMNQHDDALEELSKIVKRQQQIGLAIGNELDLQNQLLEDLDENVTRVSGNLRTADKKLTTLIGKR